MIRSGGMRRRQQPQHEVRIFGLSLIRKKWFFGTFELFFFVSKMW